MAGCGSEWLVAQRRSTRTRTAKTFDDDLDGVTSEPTTPRSVQSIDRGRANAHPPTKPKALN